MYPCIINIFTDDKNIIEILKNIQKEDVVININQEGINNVLISSDLNKLNESRNSIKVYINDIDSIKNISKEQLNNIDYVWPNLNEDILSFYINQLIDSIKNSVMNDYAGLIMSSTSFAMILKDNNDVILSSNDKAKEFFPNIRDFYGEKYSAFLETLNINNLDVEIKCDDKLKILSYEDQEIKSQTNQVVGKISYFADRTVERLYQRSIETVANTDDLTSLGNRRSVMKFLEENKDAHQLSAIMLDLDGFKKVNDSYGHSEGDHALQLVATLLKIYFKDGFKSRLGGDEFLVIYVNTDLNALEEKIQSFIKSLNKIYKEFDIFKCLTASLGLYTSYDKGITRIEDLLKKSDEALYYAKGKGKNCLVKYEDKEKVLKKRI